MMRNNCMITLLFLIAVAGSSALAQKSLRGNSNYLLGVNYPWVNYGGDFGQNAWGAKGISTQINKVSSDFAKFKNFAIKVNRWWLFSDGRAGITTSGDGTPTGVDSKFYQDLDAAIKIAKDKGVKLNLVLFDFLLVQRGSTEGGVKLGGRKDWITTKLDSLIQKVIVPLLKRYGNEPAIYSWEIMNEPEWIISDIKYPSVKDESVTQSQFFTFAKKISDAVKANTKQLLTLGSASLKWNRIWTPAYAKQKGLPALNLDYYQVHYYSWMDNQSVTNDPDLGTTFFSPIVQKVAPLKLDKPIVVGEFKQSGIFELDKFYENGYSGAWAWADNDNGGEFRVYYDAYLKWSQTHTKKKLFLEDSSLDENVSLIENI